MEPRETAVKRISDPLLPSKSVRVLAACSDLYFEFIFSTIIK